MAHVFKDMQPLRVLLLASAACACAADQSGRTISDEVEEVSLDGSDWRFELDDVADGGAGEGLRPGQEWYMPAHPHPADAIRVPGSWGSQGFGNTTAAYRHAWSGVGWYYRNLSVPASWCASTSHSTAGSDGSRRSSSKIELTIGGIMRRGRAWIDGVQLGTEHIGYLDEWNIEIEDDILCGGNSSEKPGIRHDGSTLLNKRLAVRVDNRANHSDGDCFSGCLDLRGMEAVLQVADEHTPVGMEWGGIWDHVSLRRWHPNSVSDLFVYPADPYLVVWGVSSVDLMVNISLREPATASTTVQVSISQDLPTASDGTPARDSSMHAHMVAVGAVVVPAAAQAAQLKLTVNSPNLWSPDTPAMYRATASWGSGRVLNTSVSFGIKHLTTAGPTLRLNGAALYIHGVGDDFTYMETEAPPLDKELYRTRLLTFKRFGFNFIRLHSHFEASEYMAAAAEVGILLSPALPMGAKNGSSHCARLDLAEGIYRRTWTSLILKYRNNPCLLDYSMGNEYYGMPGRPSFPFRDEFYATAKRLDPQRLVIDTDGCCWFSKGCGTGGTCNRSTNDFLVQFMGYTDNLVDPDQFSPYEEMPPKPIISHEAGDFNAMQDMTTALQVYTKQVNALPLSLAPAVAELDREGLLQESSAWAVASGALYNAMWKSTIEDMRTRRYISGYAWWTMYSYPGCAQGVLTADFKTKAVTPAQLQPFNADAVLLLAGLPRFVSASSISTSDQIAVRLSISNYLPSALALGSATVQWDLQRCETNSTTTPYESGRWTPNVTTAPQGDITSIGSWSVSVPVVPVPTCVSLQVSVHGTSCRHCNSLPELHNDWTFWVLPVAPPVVRTVYASAMLEEPLRQTGVFQDLRLMPNITTHLPTTGTTYIVSQMTPSLQDAMQAGATVLCITCSASGGGVVAYGPGLWATMGPGGARGVGTFMPEGTPLEPLARVARWLDLSWFSHIEGAQVRPYGLTAGEQNELSASEPQSAPPRVLLRWLNAPCAYSGPLVVFSKSFGGNRTFASGCQGGAKLLGVNYALLSETAIGTAGGRLLWSGLKLFPSLPAPPPSPPPPSNPPTLGFCPTSNVSACESAVRGTFLGDYSPNYEHVEQHIATSAVKVDALFLEMQGVNPHPINRGCNPNSEPVTVRGVIYDDVGGKPNQLVASTNAVTLEKSAPRNFVRLQMQNGTVSLPAGTYWLGNHIDAVCAVMWGSAKSAGRNPCVYGQRAFDDGPSPVFPVAQQGRCSGALSVFASYERNASTANTVEEVATRQRGKERGGSNVASDEALPFTPWILSLLLK